MPSSLDPMWQTLVKSEEREGEGARGRERGSERESDCPVSSSQAHQFEVYVTYCENKPKSESFLWTYQHTGGTFFEVCYDCYHSTGNKLFMYKIVVCLGCLLG